MGDRVGYTVRIENGVGTATPSPAGLAVGSVPVFTGLPADTSVYLGQTATLSGPLGTDSRTNAIRQQNTHGYLTTGERYVDSGALDPGETRRLTLEDLVPDYVTRPSPTLTPRGVALVPFTPPTGTTLSVTTNRFSASPPSRSVARAARPASTSATPTAPWPA
ncbi:MAG: hypothetical protein WCP53_13680 [Verrucomicrobiota bacterium]